MTVTETLEFMCFSRCMSEDAAAQVVQNAKTRVEGMKINVDWNGAADGYPQTVIDMLFEFHVKPAALEYIEQNTPQAFYKPLFI